MFLQVGVVENSIMVLGGEAKPSSNMDILNQKVRTTVSIAFCFNQEKLWKPAYKLKERRAEASAIIVPMSFLSCK